MTSRFSIISLRYFITHSDIIARAEALALSFKNMEKEHYYYIIYHHDQWQIVKANNQRQMRQHGYKTKQLAARFRHYDDAYTWLWMVHRCRPRYVSLTGIDLID